MGVNRILKAVKKALNNRELRYNVNTNSEIDKIAIDGNNISLRRS